MRRRRRWIVPTLLAAAGVYLLVGCIYIPTFNGVKTGQNHTKQVGDARSKKPIRVGRSTRDDVIRVLGAPFAAKADGSGLAYTWTVQNGYAVWPLCFHVESLVGRRTIVLRFDDAGRLTSFEVLKRDEPLIDLGGGYTLLPEDFRIEQRRQATTTQPGP